MTVAELANDLHPSHGHDGTTATRASKAEVQRLALLLRRLEQLPTLSPVATRLLDIASAEDADLKEIIPLIEADPALTTRVLGLCNRAGLGIRGNITTVKRAALMLGLDAVRAATLSVAVFEMLDSEAERAANATTTRPAPRDGAEAGFNRVGFWKHALGVACAAELLAKANGGIGVRAEEAFVAGLLADLGKLLLEVALPGGYAKVISLAERRHENTAGLARSIIGMDHHQAGKRVGELWGLPDDLIGVMWLHGQPASVIPPAYNAKLIGLIGVAHTLARQLHIGWSGDHGALPDIDRLSREIGLSPESLDWAAARLHDEVVDRCKLLGVDDTACRELLLESIANANLRLAQSNAALKAGARRSGRAVRTLEAVEAFVTDSSPRTTPAEVLAAACHSGRVLTGSDASWAGLIDMDGAWMVVVPGDRSTAPPELHTMPAPDEGVTLADVLQGKRPFAPSRVVDVALSAAGLGFADDARVAQIGPTSAVVTTADIPDAEAQSSLVAVWKRAMSDAEYAEQREQSVQNLASANREMAETEAERAEQEAMTKLGRVTAGAAHEMNNPLTVIRARAQLLKSKVKEGSQVAAVQAISESARELSD
ncbi:MAG: HDOD domain-containing protein, partial [Planctomycetota bacterium]